MVGACEPDLRIVPGLPRLKALRQEWESQGVAFLMHNPTSGIERTTLSHQADVYDIDYPILMDHSQLVAESLGVDRAGEILVIEPATMKLAFRGPLDEPDYIVNVPTQQIPATGVIDYIDVTIDLPFDEAKWVKAVHFRPGDTKVMHHLLTYVVPADYERGTGTTPRSERRFLEGVVGYLC